MAEVWSKMASIGASQFLQMLPLIALLSAACFLYIFRKASGKKICSPPAIPGTFMLGNSLQLRERRPHQTFTAWAKQYGPIFTIQAGWAKLVIINSSELAKEVTVIQHDSISSRKVSRPISIVTSGKNALVVGDYDEHSRMLRKLFVTHLLGPVPQKGMRVLREHASYKMLDDIFATLDGISGDIDVRHYTKQAVFSLVLNQIIGRDLDAIFVQEWGREVSRMEMFDIIVVDPLKIATEFDWRDFFPALKWVPNISVENKVNEVVRRRTAVIQAMIREETELLKKGKKHNCFLDTLLTMDISAKDLEICTWEPISEATDTSIVTIEWAMYELAMNPAIQERLYQELKEVVGEGIVTEDHLPELNYLNAVVKETLRLYPPTPILLPRLVDRDVQLGGYDIQKGSQILVNIYGVNNDPKVWPNPEVWNPDRMLAMEGVDMGYQDYRMLSFSTGKRMCAGMLQAMTVVPMTIALYVQHFKWSLPPQDLNHMPDITCFTIHRLHPLIAIATPRVSKRLNA